MKQQPSLIIVKKYRVHPFLIGKPKKKSRCGVRKPATLTILLRERT